MLLKTIAKAEAFLKGMMFDCHTCGQCVLQKTGLVCPMSCPKGLRNGPCGGTLHGQCEVYPDKQCVHVRIHNRIGRDSFEQPVLLASPDANLFRTSSYVNMVTGADKAGRTPLAYPDLGDNRTEQAVHTKSKLEEMLKTGRFIRSCEIRSPRTGSFDHFRREAEVVKPHFDCINTTAFLNGKPSLPSYLAASELQKLGLEPIAQATCRDHTKTSFVGELITNDMNDVHNVLCITGDAYTGTPKIKQVFDMDSSLMVYEARHLRETGITHFTGEKNKRPPKPFIGVAINPFTTPMNVPIRRLKQKIAAGADFIETQLIFDIQAFRTFMEVYCQENMNKDAFMIAGVPVVISKKAYDMIPHVPGVHLPEDVAARLEAADDLREEGIRFAQELITELKTMPGVCGVHLMLFGSDHSVLPEVISILDD